MRFLIFQINTDFLINQLTNYFYTRNTSLHTIKHFALSIPHAFRSIHLLTDFYCFSKWTRCAIFQINANLPVIYQKINIFTQESLYPSIIWKKKIGALHRKHFSKPPLFTMFLLFLKVSEACNISSKYWFPNKSASKIFLHKTPYTPTLFQKKNKKIALCIAEFLRSIHLSPYFYLF